MFLYIKKKFSTELNKKKPEGSAYRYVLNNVTRFSPNAEVTTRILELLLNMKTWLAKPEHEGQFLTVYVFVVTAETLAGG